MGLVKNSLIVYHRFSSDVFLLNLVVKIQRIMLVPYLKESIDMAHQNSVDLKDNS